MYDPDHPKKLPLHTNKLNSGPCSDVYELLEKCKEDSGLIKPTNIMSYCINETDLLIKCIKRNPLYYHPELDAAKKR